MARRKVKLALIPDDSARKASYNKRKKGLLKKVSELTILCDVPACAIISSPFDSRTEVWPHPEGANKIIERFQNSSVKDETRNVSHERFIMQTIAKARDKLRKLKYENHEQEWDLFMLMKLQDNNNILDGLTTEEVKDLGKRADKKLKEVDEKIDTLD